MAEAGAEILPAVVIAGYHENRHREVPTEQHRRHRVFLGAAAFGHVAGDHHHIRAGIKCCDGGQRALDQHVGLDDAGGRHATRSHMQVR